MTFRVGQKVVCIRAGGYAWDRGDNPLTEGSIYTVARLCNIIPTGEAAIGIEEYQPHNDSIKFLVTRFRPIVERKTDISIFTKMLTDKKLEVCQ